MSHAMDIAAAGDEMIREDPPRAGSGYIPYRIGKASVTYRGGDYYLCGTCKGNNRWASRDHKGCAHIQRIQRYRAEHPA